MELILLYHERWEEEQVFDEQKTHQDPRRATKPAQVRSETAGRGDPGGLCAFAGALRDPVADVRGGRDGRPGSGPTVVHRVFPGAECRLPECDGTTLATFEEWYEGLLWEMQGERTDPRRNRINPRVIKRKMVEMEEKTSRTSPSTALEESLSRNSGYDSLNGIGLRPLA